MDKPQQGNKITIKLNGERQTYEESTKIYPVTPMDPSLKLESTSYEQDVMSETAAAHESVDESFDWMIPESADHDMEEYKIVSNKKKPASFSKNYKKKSGGFAAIIIPGIFAILLGTTFGIGMLKLVIKDHSKQAVTEPKVTGTNGTQKNPEKTTTAVVKAFTTYIVQGGVYTSKESGNAAASQVSTLGVPSKSIDMDGKQYLYLAVADSQEKAKTMSGLFKQKGVEDAFAKPLQITEKTISNLSEDEKTFLEAASSIYQALAKMSSNAIAANAISEDLTKGIDEQLKPNGFKNEKIKQLKLELVSAQEKIKAYQKSKDTKSLNEVQQHLLNFLAQYYSL